MLLLCVCGCVVGWSRILSRRMCHKYVNDRTYTVGPSHEITSLQYKFVCKTTNLTSHLVRLQEQGFPSDRYVEGQRSFDASLTERLLSVDEETTNHTGVPRRRTGSTRNWMRRYKVVHFTSGVEHLNPYHFPFFHTPRCSHSFSVLNLFPSTLSLLSLVSTCTTRPGLLPLF